MRLHKCNTIRYLFVHVAVVGDTNNLHFDTILSSLGISINGIILILNNAHVHNECG